MGSDFGGAPIAPLLVLGVGNVLLRDDGAGAAILERLRHEVGPDPRMDFVDGGTQGLALLAPLAGRRGLLLLDAVALGAAPGTIHILDPNEPPARRAGTAHESNASELLAAADLVGDRPPHATLVGIEPGEIRTGIGLSPPVEGALPAATAVAKRELDRLSALLASELSQCTK
jgi:hydrogenase maturation protease